MIPALSVVRELKVNGLIPIKGSVKVAEILTWNVAPSACTISRFIPAGLTGFAPAITRLVVITLFTLV